MPAVGTTRRFAVLPMLDAIGVKADIARASRTCRSEAFDPQPTKAPSKSRSAAVFFSGHTRNR
jgi:hypothetical protein